MIFGAGLVGSDTYCILWCLAGNRGMDSYSSPYSIAHRGPLSPTLLLRSVVWDWKAQRKHRARHQVRGTRDS